MRARFSNLAMQSVGRRRSPGRRACRATRKRDAAQKSCQWNNASQVATSERFSPERVHGNEDMTEGVHRLQSRGSGGTLGHQRSCKNRGEVQPMDWMQVLSVCFGRQR